MNRREFNKVALASAVVPFVGFHETRGDYIYRRAFMGTELLRDWAVKNNTSVVFLQNKAYHDAQSYACLRAEKYCKVVAHLTDCLTWKVNNKQWT